MKYKTPKQYLRQLKIARAKKFINITCGVVMLAVAMGIIYICLTCNNDTKKLNICLQKHSLNYCNKEVK